MSEVSPINGLTELATTGVRPAERRAESSSSSTPVDSVELSDLAQTISTLEIEGDIRIDKVMQIREAIENGTYVTEDKIDVTVERLLQDLRSKE